MFEGMTRVDKTNITKSLLSILLSCWLIAVVRADTPPAPSTFTPHSLTEAAIANELGWTPSDENRCGGYYLEAPFIYPQNPNLIQISSNEGLLFSQRGTSVSQGRVTITRGEQQITANKAYLYRDPASGKIIAIDLINHVTLREPNDLVFAESAHYDWQKDVKLFHNILYRTAIYSSPSKTPTKASREELKKSRKITQLSAWGQASEFKQEEPKVFTLENATYSTCPPLDRAWQVKASHIELNQNTGRGYANNARIYMRSLPVIYTPYINFPIDSRRQTGFLWPTFSTSSKYGASVSAPYYWNIAPNYDMTTTPAILGKRGFQLSDEFRYLTHANNGKLGFAVLPDDALFRSYKQQEGVRLGNSSDPTTIAELNLLKKSNITRTSFWWQNFTRFSDNWSSAIDYNYVSDDYYLRNLSPNLNEVTQNQLLQQADLKYKNPHWNFLGRVQSYQTLHPVDMAFTSNQYNRMPQLALEGDYPESALGLDYYVMTDASHFTILNNPGSSDKFPMGNRLYLQPRISKTFRTSYFYLEPRAQYSATKYELGDVQSGFTKTPSRYLPIFDISSGLFFDRDFNLFDRRYTQTLEPTIYYLYIPYRNQNQIPIFDTTVNTLTYDQLFTYNRFSGLDRIGDADQISVGITTRLIDDDSGYEKIKFGIGQILYFKDRLVTLCADSTCSNVPACNGNTCNDFPDNPLNTHTHSPISSVLTYKLNKNWSATADAIYNTNPSQFNNETITLHYQPTGTQKIINFGYSFVRQGDVLPGDNPQSGASNLSQTDFSFSWPLYRDWTMVGRWTQNWNHKHFQNLLYGLQYDSCCWAIRIVTGRSYVNLTSNNTYQYNTEFAVQIALKGLGNINSSDASQQLSNSINGYQSNFGRDF